MNTLRPFHRHAASAQPALLEQLEPRQHLALLGVTLTERPLIFFNSTGTTDYNPATTAMDIQATPIAVTFTLGGAPRFVNAGSLQLHLRVNNSGGLIGGVLGDDLVVSGEVDVDGDGTLEAGESGILLTGEVTGFGFLHSGPPTDTFDFRFTVTGGLLSSFFAGRDAGMVLASEHSSFTGSFNVAFSGGAKGNIAPIAPGDLVSGDTATIGFWHNRNGQALLRSLNGGPTSTALGNWLATTFPRLYGALAGANNLTGKTNTEVAAAFQQRFSVRGQKLDAQVMAVAFAVYVTDTSLAGGTFGANFGFNTGSGIGSKTWNVGDNGAAFGVPNGTTLTIFQLLQAADAQAVNGVLYNFNTALRNKANTVFDDINNTGDRL